MLNKISTTILPAAAICLLFNGAANAAEWQRVAPPGLGFAIMMPSQPQASEQTVQTHWGPRPMQIFAVDGGTSAYLATYTDYKVKIDDPKTALEEVRNGQVGNGKLIADENITAAGFPGKRAIIRTADGKTIVSQFFVVSSKLYQVMYVTNAPPESAKETAAPFLKSFQLLPR